MSIQIVLSLFILFALSRVILQVKSGKLTIGSFLFWSSLFIFALVGVLDPRLTTYVANIFGIGRGSDIVIYISIALIFYLIFRLSISLEETRREISELVRKIAFEMKDIKKHRRKG
jgi:small membrane protein